MTIHHADPWLTIHGGDCRDVLATLPDASVHCVVTSPPYWGLRDYGVTGQLGLEATPEEYVANMVAVFREVRRVLRDDGTLWLNLGDSYAAGGPGNNGNEGYGDGRKNRAARLGGRGVATLKPKDLVGIPWRVAFALQADGWYLRSDIIWAKPNPMPESVTDRPTKAHEYLFLLSKAPRYFYDADAVREENSNPDIAGTDHLRKDWRERPGNGEWPSGTGGRMGSVTQGRNRRTVWTVATQPYPGAHFAVMPEALVEPCVLAGTSERGVCPTCGAPWERVVERTVENRVARVGHVNRDRNDSGASVNADRTVKTVGWRATCDHDAEPVGAVVLDPFGGSGTVARVANRLSRRAILIDLNPDYLAQQLERNRDMPLGLTA